MEERLQEEKQESEYKNPSEDQGGILRRLRDRDLLRKRKAEAEEKETNQVESQRKRPRADSGIKRRGRPKKSEPTPEISVIQEEAVVLQEAPTAVVAPESAQVVSDQTPGSPSPLLSVESQPSSVLAPQPVFGSIQIPVSGLTLTSPTPVNPSPALDSPSAPAPCPARDATPILVQDSVTAPEAVPVLLQGPVTAAAPPAAPPQVETIAKDSQGSGALDQVLIEDLGPDVVEDIPASQDKRATEDLTEMSLINVPEDEMFSIPTFSSVPAQQKYFPGNLF